MRARALLYLLTSSLLLIGACRPEKVTVFFCDPVSYEIHARRGLNEQVMERIAADQGRRLVIRRAFPGAQAEAELTALLQEREVERVLVSQLFTFDITLMAARFPDIVFIREEYAPPQAAREDGARRDNQVHIVFEREAAFARAGEAAALLAAVPGEGGPNSDRVGILSVPLSERGKRELAAFRAGFLSRGEESLLMVREVNPASDRVQARHVLEEMRQAGVGIFLFKTYDLTAFCLEELKKYGGRAIIEDYEGVGGYDEVVLLSVEDDLAGAFAACLEAAALPHILQGKTYLRWGGPAALPAPALKEELGFVRE